MIKVLLGLAIASLGCQSVPLGRAGDPSPLQGSFRSLEPGPVVPAWRQVLESKSVYRDHRHQIGGVAYDRFGDRVAVGAADGFYHCFRAGDGRLLWRIELGSGGGGAAVFAGNRIYTGTDDGRVLALNADNGRKIWSYRVQGAISQAPQLLGDTLYFVDGENAIFALDRDTGAWKWQYRRDPPAEFSLVGEAAPLIEGGKIFVGFSDGAIVALDAKDGGLLWEADLAPQHDRFQDVDAQPVLVGGRLYAASAAAGLMVLDPGTGEVLEALPIKGITQMSAVDGDVLASVDEGKLLRLRGRDGAIKWRTDFGRASGAPGDPVLLDKWVLVPLSRGGLHIVDAFSGRPVHHFTPGNGLHGPVTAGPDGRVFLLSSGGVLYALAPSKG